MNLLLWAMTHVPWDWEPSILLGCAALLGLYVWAARPGIKVWRALVFVAGDAVLLFALVSPLDTLADRYLFSAHMLQHLLLIELAAPLLLLGIPAPPLRRWLANPGVAAIERRLRRPAWAWIIGFGTLAIWHVPLFYDATVQYLPLHIFEHLSFLVSATIFWWPVLSPLQSSRLELGASVMYLFARMVGNLVLGSFVAAAPIGVYAAYLHAPPAPGPLHVITRLFDQRLGGFLMWIPTLVVDLSAAPLFAVLFLTRAARHDAVDSAADSAVIDPALPAAASASSSRGRGGSYYAK